MSEAKKRGGRPTKLTPEAQERICHAIRKGATYALAAGYGGVSYDAFNEWMKKGDAAKSGLYRQFHDAVKAAESQAAIDWLEKIDDAAAISWQAAAWKLERRYPEQYGRRINQVQGPEEQPLGVVVYIPDNGRDEPAE